jgi:VCBS repeat-containing protein
MAERQGMFTDNNDGTYTYVVEGLADDDTSTEFSLPQDTIAVSVQFLGTFDSATISVQGSNDGTTFAALPTAVANTAAGIKSLAVADLAYKYYRFFTTGGSASQDLDAVVHARTAGS